MRVTFINQTFYPDVVSTAQHLKDLALWLSEAGHEVTVVASRRAYDNPKKLFPKDEVWRGIRILRVTNTGLGKRSGLNPDCSISATFIPRLLLASGLVAASGFGRGFDLATDHFIYWRTFCKTSGGTLLLLGHGFESG